MQVSTPDLCDQYLDEVSISETRWQSYGGRKAFSGPITTVKIFDNNNRKFMEAIETAEPGSVIVMDGIFSKPCAWMGDRKAGIAAGRGIAGIIINGYVRDIEGLEKLDMGILALGTHPKASRFATEGKREGERDLTLTFGQIDWVPGHYVYADQSGVLVSEKKYN
ncbi:ribonuclease E activity regulator RraA [Halalkalibacter oceani]|uniref:4-hydroxy-4-methyl-2-oxoglutarate aldolase n=1 Tax=Halalkalibacter oceani TaxID=1653776 RepID=A0A9X2DU95_9BACI|nr:ribonuclease E activity regulator RraA [Halalkalibacter oceani]MCM3716493.1 ribonuclease E activity regulator RraA [Halalkalibacter oceani]